MTAVAIVCCAGTPPRQIDPRNAVLQNARRQGLVEVSKIVPDIRVQLRYTTPRNASGHILYPAGMPCLLREATARKIAKVQAYLREHELGLLIWDAYRPPEVQQALWDLSGRLQNFVSDPAIGWSAHCTGTAVDVTLVDLAGRPLPMPTDFDVLTPEARAIYTGKDQDISQRMRILHRAMRYAGLALYKREWWHFSDPDFRPLGRRHVVFAKSIGLRVPPPLMPAGSSRPSTTP